KNKASSSPFHELDMFFARSSLRRNDRSSFGLPVRRRGVASFWTTRRRTTPIVLAALNARHRHTKPHHRHITCSHPDADHWRLKRHEPREEHGLAAFGTAALYICNGTP